MADQKPKKAVKGIKPDNVGILEALEIYRNNPQLGQLVQSLQSALKKKNEKEVTMYATRCIAKSDSLDSNQSQWKLSTEDRKQLFEMADKDQLQSTMAEQNPKTGEKGIKPDNGGRSASVGILAALDKYKDNPQFGQMVLSLMSALKKKNGKEVKMLATICIAKSDELDSNQSQWKLSIEDYKQLYEMAYKEKIQSTAHEKDAPPATENPGTTEITAVDAGPATIQPAAVDLQTNNSNAALNQTVIVLDKDKTIEEKQQEINELKRKLHEELENITRVKEKEKVLEQRIEAQAKENEQELKKVREENDKRIAAFKRTCEENEQECKRLEDEHKAQVENICQQYDRQLKGLEKIHDQEMQEKKAQLIEMKKERDDMKTRFSKLAGEKLTDQNADIADLSDPFRAMKLSEKFGALYDDEWTDAFINLKKKMPVKDAITLLIQILKDCLGYCASISDGQINGLKNVLLHPSQDTSTHATNPSKPKKGAKEVSRISSKDEGSVYEARRKIGVTECVISEVVQGFIQETKSWGEKGYDKRHLEKCAPYIEKCAEICWLMTIHCPPLYIKLDVTHGDKLDSNYFSNYKIQSKEIDYLVWPPLFNEKNGGLLKKGVAEGIEMGSEK